ncbi:MAG: hypothetical protein ABI988_13915 [Nitrospirota bacterium]
MAGAFTGKKHDERLGNHTGSSAVQHGSTCARCGGLMVQDFCLDVLGNMGESEFAATRCVQCGEVVDFVILLNRQIGQEPVTAERAGKMLPNNCVMESR